MALLGTESTRHFARLTTVPSSAVAERIVNSSGSTVRVIRAGLHGQCVALLGTESTCHFARLTTVPSSAVAERIVAWSGSTFRVIHTGLHGPRR